jgi:hypothetical protein
LAVGHRVVLFEEFFLSVENIVIFYSNEYSVFISFQYLVHRSRIKIILALSMFIVEGLIDDIDEVPRFGDFLCTCV